MALRQEAFIGRGASGTDLYSLTADFRRSLLRQERSLNTVRTYAYGWKSFLKFLATRGVTDSDQLTRDLVQDWQDSLRVKPRTKALASTAVRRLLTFAARQDVIEYKLTLSVDPVKIVPLLPHPIPPEHLERIARWLERPRARASIVGLRNRAMFWYLVTTGARVSELLQLTRDQALQAVYVIQKGGMEKLMLCPPAVVLMIADYLVARDDTCRWLWVTHTSNGIPHRLTAKAVRDVWIWLARQARVPRFTTHTLRHTSATELFAAGVPEGAIAEHLGHHDLRYVMNYAKVDVAHRQKVVDVMDRLARKGYRDRS